MNLGDHSKARPDIPAQDVATASLSSTQAMSTRAFSNVCDQMIRDHNCVRIEERCVQRTPESPIPGRLGWNAQQG